MFLLANNIEWLTMLDFPDCYYCHYNNTHSDRRPGCKRLLQVNRFCVFLAYPMWKHLLCVQEMLTMSLACMELQLEQWSLTRGKTGE